MLVDAIITTRVVLNPESLDTVIATNLLQHADILSDLAAALDGSIGIAPTSKLDPTPRTFPCSSPPTGRQTLEWLGKKESAAQLMECVERVTGRGVVTVGLGGKTTTKEVTAAVKAFRIG
ncbi:hypothetical protein LX36DRAFT_749195 [Colletotrichum falcatum]|nr:hypothetical protein LX36DRAFT_749195 [Colletotrichum falcatum]